MKMNRRQALIGIGSLAVGSGAALGSGAFTSVEANRDVTLQTSGDSSAYLSLVGDDEYISNDGTGDSVLTIDLGAGTPGSGFNNDAITEVAGIVEISNSAADSSSFDIGFPDGSGGQIGSKTVTIGDGSGSVVADVTFTISTGSSYSDSAATPTVDTSTTVYMHAEIDTTVSSGTPDGSEPTLTLLAE
jgi:hypothetical protein